jgi:leucyl-tRNA synthetase
MSKSKHNGVDPSDFITRYGADVTRAHILFQAPVSDVLEWEEDRVVGVQRWFQRMWSLVDNAASLSTAEAVAPNSADYTDAEVRLHNALHAAAESVTVALERTYALNTCVSDLMQLTNAIHDAKDNVAPALFAEATRNLVRLLAPFAPAFASECWEHLYKSAAAQAASGKSAGFADVFAERFPTTEMFPLLAVRSQTVAVMQNGKLRLTVDLPVPAAELLEQTSTDALREWVLGELNKTEKGRKWLQEKEWKRVVVAKGGKTINFVG